MKKAFPHYGDILKKTERIIDSCETLDQIGSAWRFADLFENHCKKIGVNDQTLMVMRANINNQLEDKWENLIIEKLNSVENGGEPTGN